MLRSFWKLAERHPYRMVLGAVAVLAALVGVTAYFGTPTKPGTVSVAHAVMGSALVFLGCLPLLGVVRLLEKISVGQGNPSAKGVILGLSMAGELLWIVGALTVAAKFGVSLPSHCGALLSFQSPLVWLLVAGSIAGGFAWGLREGLRARQRAHLATAQA